MIARAIALSVSLAWCTVAMGGADVVIQCVNNADCNPGPGGTDTAEIYLVGDQAQLLRYAQFDLTQTSSDLVVTLPVTHGAPTSEIAPTDDLHFWDFNSTDTCSLGAECAFGHVVDDDLSGVTPPGPADIISMVYIGDLSNPENPDLRENIDNQWLLQNGTMQKIGELEFTCPNTAGAGLTLDLANAAETDPALGAIIEFGFDPRVTWRADTGDITGGTIQVCGGDVPAILVATDPLCRESLWQTKSNTMRLTFDRDLPSDPAPGEVVVAPLMDGGTLGTPLAGFSMARDPGDSTVLVITEPDPGVLTNQNWYGIRNMSWTGVAPFDVLYVKLTGDASNNNSVDFTDVNQVLASTGQGVPPAPARRDIDANNSVDFTDVNAVLSRTGTGALPEPSEHVCTVP